MSSPNISFETIPSSIRKPGAYMEFNTRLAVRTLPSNKQRLVIIGQRLAAGTVAAGQPVKVFSDAEAAGYFGRGSIVHLMVKAAITANRYVEITAVGVDDAGASAAATGKITFTGTATTAGTVMAKIGAQTIELAIPSQQTAAQAATALQAQLANYPDLPVTGAVAGGEITFTARNKGTLGNDVFIDATSTAAGLNVATTAFSAGAVDPDLTANLANLFALSDEIIVTPYATQTALTTLRTHLDSRSDSIEQRGAVGVFASRGTLSAATTLSGQLNAGRLVQALLPGTASLSYQLAAAFAAVVAFEEDPARPLNNLSLPGIAAPSIANRLSRTEQEVCLANGVTPLQVGPGEQVQIVRAVTTYTTNQAGSPDIALLDLTTIRTFDYCRKAWRDRILLRFPRDKRTPEIRRQIRSELLDVAIKLEELGIIENVEANKDGFIVEDDSQDPNRVNARIPMDVVNGLHVFAGRIDLLL